MTLAFLLVASLTILSGCARAEMSADDLAKQRAIARVASFMLTGDTTNLRSSFSDSVLVLLPIDGMSATRADWVANYGQCQSVSPPEFDSAQEAHLDIEFERATLAVTLAFDSTFAISFVSVAIEPGKPVSEDSTFPVAILDHRLADIVDVSGYAAHFSSDSQHVRLVALLSPT